MKKIARIANTMIAVAIYTVDGTGILFV